MSRAASRAGGAAAGIAGICELTLEVRELEPAERFYTQLLGLAVLSRDEDRVWLACGSRSRLGLWLPGRREFGDEGGSHVHFALAAEPGALAPLAGRLREHGVEVEGPVEHPGGDRSIYFRDPAGNVVELWDFLQRGEGRAEGIEALA
jgi:catechol-2,3-dioxygenase